MNSNEISVSNHLQITYEDCKKIIRNKFKANNCQILNYELTNLTQETGFLGEYCRLTIIIKTNETVKEVNCFAKFMSTNKIQQQCIKQTGAFKKEIFIYDELFPKLRNANITLLQSCVPECYYIKPDYVLIFDDVKKAGFKPVCKHSYLNLNQVLVVLKSMCKLHASSLIYEEMRTKLNGKPYRLIDDYNKDFFETLYVNDLSHKGGQGFYAAVKGLLTAIDLFPDENQSISNTVFKERVYNLCTNIFRLTKPSIKYRNVVCHGDLWAPNFLIKYNPDKDNNEPMNCLFVDFQTARYCPPAHDFMSFLHLTTTRDFRATYLQQLQNIYFNELEQLLKQHDLELGSIITYEEFVQSCVEQKLSAIIQTATYAELTYVKMDIQELFKDPQRLNDIMYKDRSLVVIENCKVDQEYKQILENVINELREYCI